MTPPDHNLSPDEVARIGRISDAVIVTLLQDLGVEPNIAVNVCFQAYAQLILGALDMIQTNLNDPNPDIANLYKGTREEMRDNVLIQLQKLIDVLGERVPRMTGELN